MLFPARSSRDLSASRKNTPAGHDFSGLNRQHVSSSLTSKSPCTFLPSASVTQSRRCTRALSSGLGKRTTKSDRDPAKGEASLHVLGSIASSSGGPTAKLLRKV